MTNFIQYLVLLLIGLLFGKEYLLPPLLKKFGLNGTNYGGKKIGQIEEKLGVITENHLEHISVKLDKLITNSEKQLLLLDDIRDKLKK